MGTFIIKNYSTLKDEVAIELANATMHITNPDQLIKDVGKYNVGISVQHNEKTGAMVATIIDRD